MQHTKEDKTETSDEPISEIGFVCLVSTLLIVFPAIILIGVGVADPYPWAGEQSARWWWLRYPLVFAGLLILTMVQIIIVKVIDDEDFAKEVERATSAAISVLFAAAIVIVTFGGGTVMNLYNAAYGERSIVKAKRTGMWIAARGVRGLLYTNVSYEILEGPLTGESISLHWSDSFGHGSPADDGKLALVSLRRSWMGVSVLGAYDQETRVPDSGE